MRVYAGSPSVHSRVYACSPSDPARVYSCSSPDPKSHKTDSGTFLQGGIDERHVRSDACSCHAPLTEPTRAPWLGIIVTSKEKEGGPTEHFQSPPER